MLSELCREKKYATSHDNFNCLCQIPTDRMRMLEKLHEVFVLLSSSPSEEELRAHGEGLAVASL